MAASLPPGGDAFLGGSQRRGLAPPSVNGALAPANTANNPLGGVQTSTIKNARQNEGSNIGVPYARMVSLIANPSSKRDASGARVPNNGESPTENLRDMTLCFVQGYEKFHNRNLAPRVTGGGQQMDRLCSLEFLQDYFVNDVSFRTIRLNKPLNDIDEPRVERRQSPGKWTPGNGLTLADTDTLLSTSDFGKSASIAEPGSALASAPERYQGIFARDTSPFLRGKGVDQRKLDVTRSKVVTTFPDDVMRYPNQRSINLGDEVAFAGLEKELANIGALSWQPDGIVLSVGSDDPSDAYSNAAIAARDGQLHNVRVQGPAVTSTWSGDPAMEVLPLDKLFVVLVADVWFDLTAGEDKEKVDAFAKGGADARAAYMAHVDAQLSEKRVTKDKEAAYVRKGYAAYQGGTPENTVLTNFRVMLSTSSHIVNHSALRHGQPSSGTADAIGRRADYRSRCGLRLAENVGEFIVYGWQIGQVLDTSASRPANVSIPGVVKAPPNTSAINVNVSVGAWSADQLWRTFHNREGKTTPRYQQHPGKYERQLNISGEKAAIDAAANPSAVAPSQSQQQQQPPPQQPQQTAPPVAGNLPPPPPGGVPYPTDPTGAWTEPQVDQLWNLLVTTTGATGNPPTISRAVAHRGHPRVPGAVGRLLNVQSSATPSNARAPNGSEGSLLVSYHSSRSATSTGTTTRLP